MKRASHPLDLTVRLTTTPTASEIVGRLVERKRRVYFEYDEQMPLLAGKSLLKRRN